LSEQNFCHSVFGWYSALQSRRLHLRTFLFLATVLPLSCNVHAYTIDNVYAKTDFNASFFFMETKKRIGPSDLAEIIKEIRRREGGVTQSGFAELLNKQHPRPENEDDVLYVRPGDIQRLESAGRNLRGQFALFVKLLPLCLKHDLIRACDLLSPDAHEVFKHLESNSSPTHPSGKGRKVKNG
jgi:hypothetical protein